MLSKFLFVFLCLCLGSVFGWTLVWQDEFKGPQINQSAWNVRNQFTHEGNNELELYMSDDCYIQNGQLVMKSEARSVSGHKYTSCWLDTKGKVVQQYARVEISAKLPQGKGIWPAHWMMPNDNSCWPTEGEIDIMEYIGKDASQGLGSIYGTLHWSKGECGANSQDGGVVAPNGIDFTKGFHQYAVEWTAQGITWFVDGKAYHTTPSSMFGPNHPFYLILNTAVGGDWPGPPDAQTQFPQYHYVEYVRLYKQ